jgi:hypothetical protein
MQIPIAGLTEHLHDLVHFTLRAHVEVLAFLTAKFKHRRDSPAFEPITFLVIETE